MECVWRNHQNEEEVQSFHMKNDRKIEDFLSWRKKIKIMYPQFKINSTQYEKNPNKLDYSNAL